MAQLRFILLAFVLIVENTSGESNVHDVLSLSDVGSAVKSTIGLNQTLSTVNSTIHGLPKLISGSVRIPVKRETRMDFLIEEDDAITKKPRKNRKRTKRPKRKGKQPQDSADDYEDDQTESDESDEATGTDGIVQDTPNNNDSKRKPKKTKKEEHGKVFFEETFSERGWDSAWVYSKMEYGDDKGKKKYEKFYRIRSRRGKKGFDYGLVTSNKGTEDYAISAPFQPLNSNDGPLVVQFGIQYQSAPHCENVYLRLFDCKFKPEEFTPESPYLIQMGPNICTKEKHVSVVLTDPVKGERYVLADKLEPVTSTELHMYSLIIQQDGNYQILINDKSAQNGSLTTVFPNYQGFPSICAVGLNIWHSILDKFFKGQIIIDDILITSDLQYAKKRRTEILEIVVRDANTNSTKKVK